MSTLGEFVPNLRGYLARRISQIFVRQLKRSLTIGNRKKHKTLSYLSVLTVTGLQMCTTSAVCGSRGFEPGSLLHRTSFLVQVKEKSLRRSAVSCANSSGNVYLTPTYDSTCNLASSEASCGVSEMHLSG